MSRHAIEDALFVRGITPQARLVLAVLAQHADNKSGRCYPSLVRIAAFAGLSTERTRALLRELQVAGLIHREDNRKGGRKIGRKHRLDLDLIRQRAAEGRAKLKNMVARNHLSGDGNMVAGNHLSGAKGGCPQPVNVVVGNHQNLSQESVSGEGRSSERPSPSIESGVPTTPPAPHEGGEGQDLNSFAHLAMGESTKSTYPGTDLASGFEEFWDAYPRKVGKGDAVRAWGALKPDAELLDDILVGVARARTHNEMWKERESIPYPAAWLRGQRWTDELGETDGKSLIIRDGQQRRGSTRRTS